MTVSRNASYAGLVILIACVYCATAKLSLLVAIPPGYATAVWPPSGIALAATLLWGRHVWPGIWLGAALTNLSIQGSLLLAVLIASGNTLEAVAATAWIRRVLADPPRLTSGEDVVKFVGLSALGATIAAVLGVLSLALTNAIPWSGFADNVWTWWQGDTSGMIVVTPLILSWASRDFQRWPVGKAIEAAILISVLVLVTVVVFSGRTAEGGAIHLAFLALPFVIWVAIRFEQREVTTAVAVVSAISIWQTLQGHGPFSVDSPNSSLLFLVAYISTLALTGLVLNALIGERKRAFAELNQNNEMLAARIRESMRDLENANQSLRADLVERSLQEEKLRQSEERFRLLVDGVKDYAIILLDVDGNVVSWNTGAQNLEGFTAAEVIGTHFSRFYTGEDIARGHPTHALAVARDAGRYESDCWRVRKNGGRFWANTVITALYDSRHRLGGFAKLTRDLTLRRRIETLQENERQMNEFLAMLSHELRNPLAPIVTALDLMRTRGEGEQAELRVVIERQVTLLTRIIEDLLDIGRITHGKIALKKELLDLNEIVVRVLESSRALSEARGQTVECHLPDAPLTVDADPTRLTQIILNLINNAIKYTPERGRISVALSRDADAAVLQVRDSGIGIAPALLPKVFDLFVQGDRALDRAESGLGIGLTLVRQLVEMHEGTVAAFSDGLGKGSEFIVRLPVAEAEATAAAPAPRERQGAAPPRRRLLIVDDNRDFADTMAALLEAFGHEVRTAYDGHAVAPMVADFEPHAILLDIGLPGIDGYEVARQLRASPRHSRLSLIAVSGYGQEADRYRAQQAGFDHHLVKPVAAEDIQKIIDALT